MEPHHSSNGQKLKARSKHYPNSSSTAAIRMLCHVLAAGGVIGHGGSVVRDMENRIGVRISLSGAIPGCVERIVTVIGSDVVNRKVRVERLNEGKRKEDVKEDMEEAEEVIGVSPVQEAVLRVFERSLEVDAENYGNGEAVARGGNERGSCCCRLLADRMQCGILIGKGGRRVAQICGEYRANIRVLRSKQNPACASRADKIIHDMEKAI